MKNKHMTKDDRDIIEEGLKNNKSFKQIGQELGKDCTTISKEVRNNYYVKDTNSRGNHFFDCVYRHECPYKEKNRMCYVESCKYYKQETCKKLDKPPYVCNGCDNKLHCNFIKHIYSANKAQVSYEERLVDSRVGISYTNEELQQIDSVLKPLIADKGQSIHNAVINNQNKLMLSEREIYRLIDMGVISVRNIDLPRKVRFRQRIKNRTAYKVDKTCLENRRWSNYQDYIKEHPDTNVVEIDSVIGIKGGKCLLTIHFVNCSFMLAFLRDSNDAQSVIDIFNNIQSIVGLETFKRLFPIILTDNGSEFSNPTAIETDPNTGEKRTKVFYCQPRSANQKGSCEVNHEFIRRILPQGTSFNDLTQKDINLMMSHINSYKRAKLNNKSPYEVFALLYGEDIANKLGIVKFDDKDICLKSDLLKK